MKTRESLVGDRLGKYEILREIGAGAMGIVFEGRHEVLHQRAAVKILADHVKDDPKLVDRFYFEGRSLAKLRHQHIVMVFDLGEEDETHYMAMEYVDGRNLDRWMCRMGTLQPLRALDLARQIADALNEAHENGIVHRDIKPENVMVTRQGLAKVMDFGIAESLDPHDTAPVGDAPGTPRYMSPEQCQGKFTDARTDIYSLGVVLFEMLAGRPPFALSGGRADLMDRIINQEAPSPCRANGEITPAVERIVMKMLEKNPENRYKSAGDLAEDIRACIRIKAYSPDFGKRKSVLTTNPIASILRGKDDEKDLRPRSGMPRRREDRELIEQLETLRTLYDPETSYKRTRRSLVRKKCRCKLRALDDATAEAFYARVLDISQDGAQLFSEKNVTKGTRLEAKFNLDDDLNFKGTIEARWSRTYKTRDGYQIGFAFVELAPAAQRSLKAFLQTVQESSGLT